MKLPCKSEELMFIVWRNATTLPAPVPEKLIGELGCQIVTNVGWIANENAERVALVHESSPAGFETTLIPVGSIIARLPVVGKPTDKQRQTIASVLERLCAWGGFAHNTHIGTNQYIGGGNIHEAAKLCREALGENA